MSARWERPGMKVGIVSQRDNERAIALAERLVDRLQEQGVGVAIDESTAASLAAKRGEVDDTEALPGTPTGEMSECDLVVSIGGDGTFLYTARAAGATPVMGVNLGEVGFLNAISPDDAIAEVLEEVDRVSEGRGRTRELPRLVAESEGWELAPGLNEVLVQGPRRGHGGGATFSVRIDGAEYTRGHADGVLVATPTGSTAYNLSEGGPLVHPAVPGLVVTLMAGGKGVRPLVVDVDSEVTITVEDAETAIAVSDGRTRETLDPPAAVQVRTAGEPARITGPPREFFAALGKLE
jgi:NAD+ kinase